MRDNGTLAHWLKGLPVPEWTRRPRAKDELRQRAVAMRLDGRSYREITEALDVAKSSLSLWLRDVPMTEEHRRALQQRRAGAGAKRAASLKARRVASERRVKREAAQQIGALSGRELFIAGVVAYWAEGRKSKPWSRGGQVDFVNSDATMIRLFLRWLELLGVPRQGLVLRVAIHERADVAGAERFWSRVTGIPLDQFRRATLKRHNPKTIRKNVGPDYVGCLTITVRRSTDLYRRIAGWYEGIMQSLGRGVTATRQILGLRDPGSNPGAPAEHPSTLFEPSPAYQCHRAS